MKFSFSCIMHSLLLYLGCTGNKTKQSETKVDSVPCTYVGDTIAYSIVVETDSVTSTSEDGGWAPDEFRSKHYDEWVVVSQAIDIQQNGNGNIDFSKIDKLVRQYIKKKKIRLPLEKCRRIKRIDEICQSKFDISGYDESNLGMHIADGTGRLFTMYVNWLYQREARRVLRKNRMINIDRELKLYTKLNDAFMEVCDSIAYCTAGSGAWVTWSQVQYFSENFNRNMYQAILGAKVETGMELDVPLAQFDRECKAMIYNYQPYEAEQPRDATRIMEKYRKAFHNWYTYRKSVASRLRNGKFKKAYQSITYSNARLHFLHLKNRFNDMGMMSSYMSELCLPENCSNKELLEFNFENKD